MFTKHVGSKYLAVYQLLHLEALSSSEKLKIFLKSSHEKSLKASPSPSPHFYFVKRLWILLLPLLLVHDVSYEHSPGLNCKKSFENECRELNWRWKVDNQSFRFWTKLIQITLKILKNLSFFPLPKSCFPFLVVPSLFTSTFYMRTSKRNKWFMLADTTFFLFFLTHSLSLPLPFFTRSDLWFYCRWKMYTNMIFKCFCFCFSSSSSYFHLSGFDTWVGVEQENEKICCLVKAFEEENWKFIPIAFHHLRDLMVFFV